MVRCFYIVYQIIVLQSLQELNSNLKDVRIKIYNHKSKYNKLLSTLEFLRLNIDLKVLAKAYVDGITEFNILSQDVTYSHHDYYYNLSFVNYTSSDFYSFKTGLSAILAKTKFCNDTDLVLQILKLEIYKAFLDKS